MSGHELEVIEGADMEVAGNLFGTRDPAVVISEARRYADVLVQLVAERELYTVISGKKFVHVTGWQLLGSMLGVFAVGEGEPEYVEVQGAKDPTSGFKATVTAQTRDGQIVGRETAYCMRDEGNWKSKPVYALAGMAQTRAAGRALRSPLSFIVKLAGYETVLAEEAPAQVLPEDDGPDDTPETK